MDSTQRNPQKVSLDPTQPIIVHRHSTIKKVI